MISEGWEIRKIGELVERVRKPVSVEKDAIYQQIGIRSHAKGLFYKEPVTGEQLGDKKVFWIEPNCFILNIVFAWERAVAATSINETGMIASHRFPMFKPDENRLCLEYLTRYFHTPQGQDALSLVSPGGAGRNKTLDQTAFLKLSIPVPPLKEQKKIAEILSSVDEAIASTQAVIDQTRKVKQGLLQQLLTRGIGHKKFKETAIGRIPESWKITTAQEVCKTISVGIVVKPTQYYVQSGVPCFRSANIQEGYIQDKDWVYISEESNELLAKSKLRTGDVLVVRSGYPGTSCVVSEKFNGANCVDVIFARPDQKIVLPEYFSWFINSSLGKRQILKAQGGLAQQHFNVGSLNLMKVSIPPLEEQKEIIDTINSIQVIISNSEAELEAMSILKRGLMQDLLTGHVRVSDSQGFS